jgi:hypothetical protein
VKHAHPDRQVRVFYMDEARFGQQGTLTKMWAAKGSRPTAVKQTKYEWVYLYAAVDPVTGDAPALLLRHVDTDHMNAFLGVLSASLGPDEHAVLIMDNAGWHRSGGLKMPANVTPLFLPPYSPELNPVERLWAYLKSHYLSNRAFADYDALLAAGVDAWNALTKDLLKSICHAAWLSPGNHA